MTKINSRSPQVLLSVRDLIMPYFVVEGNRKKEPVKNMPGIARLSIDLLVKEIAKAKGLGIREVILFGICPSRKKNATGDHAYSAESVVARAVTAIKQKVKGISVITDICLCAYTDHGHCGILKKNPGTIDSRPTLEALSEMALTHARAGADWVAPSAMAHQQVRAIRRKLDRHSYPETRILGYSAKFASNFYGPFRDAAASAPKFGDRSAYQLNYADPRRALREIAEDIREGAAMVMVKPALSYLDILKDAKTRFDFPLAAYNVSGEYALVKYGARDGLWNERKMVFEILVSIKRAGADRIITYHATDVAKWLGVNARSRGRTLDFGRDQPGKQPRDLGLIDHGLRS